MKAGQVKVAGTDRHVQPLPEARHQFVLPQRGAGLIVAVLKLA